MPTILDIYIVNVDNVNLCILKGRRKWSMRSVGNGGMCKCCDSIIYSFISLANCGCSPRCALLCNVSWNFCNSMAIRAYVVCHVCVCVCESWLNKMKSQLTRNHFIYFQFKSVQYLENGTR